MLCQNLVWYFNLFKFSKIRRTDIQFIRTYNKRTVALCTWLQNDCQLVKHPWQTDGLFTIPCEKLTVRLASWQYNGRFVRQQHELMVSSLENMIRKQCSDMQWLILAVYLLSSSVSAAVFAANTLAADGITGISFETEQNTVYIYILYKLITEFSFHSIVAIVHMWMCACVQISVHINIFSQKLRLCVILFSHHSESVPRLRIAAWNITNKTTQNYQNRLYLV